MHVAPGLQGLAWHGSSVSQSGLWQRSLADFCRRQQCAANPMHGASRAEGKRARAKAFLLLHVSDCPLHVLGMQLRDLVPPQTANSSVQEGLDSKRPKHVVLSDTIALVKDLQIKVCKYTRTPWCLGCFAGQTLCASLVHGAGRGLACPEFKV